tara:strand:+ start:282 stop:821 length:540 start_codon:yes stop_codon:yes gene_type:complete
MTNTTFLYPDDYSELTPLDTFGATMTSEDLDDLIEISHLSDTASDSELRHMINDNSELLETTEYEWQDMESADVLDILIEIGFNVTDPNPEHSPNSIELLDKDQYEADIDWVAVYQQALDEDKPSDFKWNALYRQALDGAKASDFSWNDTYQQVIDESTPSDFNMNDLYEMAVLEEFGY